MRHTRTLSFPNGPAGGSRLAPLLDLLARRDPGRRVLLAANDRQVAYGVHLVLAALFFSPFFLFGYTLFANADLVLHNYPMLLLAKRNFLSGSLGLWNPYTFFGAPESVAAGTPGLFPENWLLFLIPEDHLFRAITFFAFLKVWLIGVAAYRFYCAELLNRRWALFASVTYQLSGWVIWCIVSYVALSVFLYYTILLVLIWTMARRSHLANYLLLATVTALLLLSGNISHAAYALLGAGILFLYRVYSHRDAQPLIASTAVFTMSCVTALLIFCARLLPILETLQTGTRQGDCCRPFFGNASFLVSRLFDTEVLGISYSESIPMFQNVSPIFEFHLHGTYPDFFGVIAALLVVWALVSDKGPRAVFWSLYTALALALTTFVQPYENFAVVLLRPFYHPLSLHLLLPVGFAGLAALGGASLERLLRRGRLPRVSVQLLVFAVVTAVLLVVIVATANIDILSRIGSLWARLLAAGLVLAALFLPWVYRAYPRFFSSLALPLLWLILIFGAATALFVSVPVGDQTFGSHLRNVSTELMLFAFIAIVVTLTARGQTFAAWRLGLWGGGLVVLVCLAINLYPWTKALSETLTHKQSLLMMGLGSLRSLVGLGVFFFVLSAAAAGRLPARSIYIVFFLLLLAEQIPAQKVHSHINMNPFTSNALLYPPLPKSVDASGAPVEVDLVDYRVNFSNTFLRIPFYDETRGASNEICASANVAYGVRSYGGFNNTIPVRTLAFLRNWDPLAPGNFCIYAKVKDDRFLDLTGVGYDYDGRTGTVARRPGALSRFMLFTRYDLIASDAAVLKRLKDAEFVPLDQIVLQEDPGFPSRDTGVNGLRLKATEFGPDRIEVDVSTDGPALLVFNDSFNAGWSADIAGEPQKIVTADYNFMAVAVPAGESRVVLRYRPQSFLLGLTCAGAGLLLLIGTLLAYLVRRRWIVQPQGSSS